MRTGMARAARPARNSGERNDIEMATGARWRLMAGVSSDVHQLRAARQITEERVVERIGRVEDRVIDAMLRKPRGQRGDVLADQRAVLLDQRLGNDRNLLAALEILKGRRVFVGKFELR